MDRAAHGVRLEGIGIVVWLTIDVDDAKAPLLLLTYDELKALVIRRNFVQISDESVQVEMIEGSDSEIALQILTSTIPSIGKSRIICRDESILIAREELIDLVEESGRSV